MDPDCHKILKCVCAQMGITMSDFLLEAGQAHMTKSLDENEHLKTLVFSLPLTPGGAAYNLREQMAHHDQTVD